MKKRKLGNTNLYVSEISFGGASIGNLYNECTDAQSREVIETSLRLGINFFDTAPEYGHGLSERRIGDALRTYAKEDYVLSTKVGDILFTRHDSMPIESKFINKLPFHLRFDYSYDGIMRAFEDSLQRLGLHRIDVLLVHDLDPIVHNEKVFPQLYKNYLDDGYKALDKLRGEGVVKAIGLGVKKWEVCADAMKYGDYDCHMLQGNYTLLEQPAFESFLATCLKKQTSILLAGPYASGILATGAVPGASFHHRAADETILERVRTIQSICDAHHVPMQAVAIQFPLRHPAVTSVVVGSASAELMQKNIAYTQVTILPSLWDALKQAAIIPQDAP